MEREVKTEAFASKTWREALDGVRIALGVSVSVVDASSGPLTTSGPLPLCDVLCRNLGGPTLACISLRHERCDEPSAPVRGVCEGGMPCTVAPVRIDDGIACFVVLTGYAGSSQERRRALADLLAAGMCEAEAREVTDDMPVMTRERADASARLVASRAELILRTFGEDAKRRGRQRELSVLSQVAHDLGAGARAYDRVPASALATVMRLTAGACARLTLVQPGGALTEAAVVGDCELLPDPSETAAHVVGTGRSLVTSGAATPGGPHTALAVPLRRGQGIIGVLEVAKSGPPALGGDDMRLVELFAEVVSAMLENANAFIDANTKLVELIQVNEVAKALNATLDRSGLSELAVQVLSKTLDFGVGGFVTDGFGPRRGRVIFSDDVTLDDIAAVLVEADGGSAPDPLAGVTVVPQLASLIEQEGATGEWTVLATDLRYRNVRAGTLFVASRTAGSFRAHDERVLEALAAHLSIALENATLYERLETEFQRAIAALSALADAQEARNDGHTDRVMDYAMALGREIGLPVDRVELVRFAGLLHDVGKSGIAEEILLKPSALTPDEMERVRRHSELGASIVEQISFLEELTPIVRHHHEHFDGTGYPDCLAGSEIPLEARVLAVADAYESMTSNAAHRKRLPAATARLELERNAGTQFDPRVVSAFLRVLERRALAGASGLLAQPSTDGPQLPA
ncbi:MAG: HD domain-containing protein [Coriobacteriia bacterium]|nr:HD domain-containing protein [Coriobacteriia bacterium]